MPELSAVRDVVFQYGDHWSACSIQGANRARNSDALAVCAEGTLRAFAVADGVGTMEGSPVASRAAADAAAAWVRDRRDVLQDDVLSLLATVNYAVGAALHAGGEAGATTLACALVSGHGAIVTTIGDSEALAIGPLGPARRLNDLDHVPGRPNMLLAWIDGEAEFDPHIIALDSMPHRLCLVTDGIVKVLDYRKIATIVRGAPVPTAARSLVEAARAAGATDDVTALVLSGDLAAAK